MLAGWLGPYELVSAAQSMSILSIPKQEKIAIFTYYY